MMGDNIPQRTRQTDGKVPVTIMLVSLYGSRAVVEYQKWGFRREDLVDEGHAVKIGPVDPPLHPVDESL